MQFGLQAMYFMGVLSAPRHYLCACSYFLVGLYLVLIYQLPYGLVTLHHRLRLINPSLFVERSFRVEPDVCISPTEHSKCTESQLALLNFFLYVLLSLNRLKKIVKNQKGSKQASTHLIHIATFISSLHLYSFSLQEQ